MVLNHVENTEFSGVDAFANKIKLGLILAHELIIAAHIQQVCNANHYIKDEWQSGMDAGPYRTRPEQ